MSNLPTLEKAIFSLKSEEIRLRREASDHRSSIVLGKEISAEVCIRNADCISVVLEYVRECQQREMRNAERIRQQAIADMIGWDGALPIDLEEALPE